MTLSRRWMPSPNYSSRGGSRVRLIVVHTAEGATTIENLGAYFANPSSGVSSHTGIDDKPNVVGEFVARGNKAWTAANANPVAVQTELCGFAAWNPSQWAAHPTMLSNCAQWIAEEAAYFGIPLTRLNAAQAQGGASGVCGHNELGAWGGGHWDPGPSFPWDQVMAMAQGSAPGPPSTGGGAVEICGTPSGRGYWVCGSDGGVFTYGDAGFYGSLGNVALAAPIVGMAATPSGRGYWLLGKDGGVFTFGDAAFYGAPTGQVR